MARNCRRIFRWSGLLVAYFVAAVVAPTSVAAQTDRQQKSFGEAVIGFLDHWLVKRAPEAAVRQHLSHQVNDARLLPRESFSAVEYEKRFVIADRRPQPIPNEAAVRKMSDYLAGAIESEQRAPKTLKDALAPLNSESDPELWRLLARKDLNPNPVDSLPIVWIPIHRWEHFSWTASPTIGHRVLIPQRIQAMDLQMRGVLFRIPHIGSPRSSLALMLWADESRSKRGPWKFWGLIPVPTE